MSDPRKDPSRRCLPVEEWPCPDREAWNNAIRAGDLLDGSGAAAHWREDTRKKVQSSYGRYLTFLKRKGALNSATGPETRVTPDLLRAYIEELRETVSPVTLAGRITDLSEALRVMVPDHHFPFLRRAQLALAARAKAIRNKRQRILPPADLFDLGIRLMSEAERNPCPRPVWRACRYRDGLMIAMLAARALRRRNFAGIILGKHLRKVDNRYVFMFDGSETKNHRPIEMSLPSPLTGYIDRYLEHYRPILLGAAQSDHLWISSMARPMAHGAIYDKVREVTERELGRPVNLHLFRDCQATALAIEDPEHVRIAAAILGHTNLRTTEKYYNQARMLEAVRRHQDCLVSLRRDLKRSPRHVRRR